MKLSDHFTLEEMTVSQEAARRHLDNTPPAEVVDEIRRTCTTLLEEIRKAFGGEAVIVTSGYRSPAVNAAVGGVAGSAHVFGRAADIIVPSVGSPKIVCMKILGIPGLDFDQLIHEFGAWTHVAIAAPGLPPRRQVLTIDGNGTREGL